MCNKLIDFWAKYVSQNDRENEIPESDSLKDKILGHKEFDDLIKSEIDFDDNRFHPGLLPLPYVGDLKNAKVFILMLNPGVHLGDYHAEENDYKKVWERNIRQRFLKNDYRFFFLNPKFANTPGFEYWSNKLKDIINKAASKEGSYENGLKFVSNGIASLDLIPYRSFKAPSMNKAIRELESVTTIKKVAQSLAEQGRNIIVLRSYKEWDFKEDDEKKYLDTILYRKGIKGQDPQAASLSENSTGDDAILKALGLK